MRRLALIVLEVIILFFAVIAIHNIFATPMTAWLCRDIYLKSLVRK